MRRFVVGIGVLAASFAGISAVQAAGTIKIGMILPYSGQFADTATQLDNAVKLFMKQHGDTVAGKKIEIIRKDVGGIAPDTAKRLAQELIVRDKVDMLAGFVLTPNAFSAGDVSKKGKKFMVVMNAATATITTKSPYMVRTSLTVPQVVQPLGTWAAQKGIKTAYTVVADYGPGHDGEQAFKRGFESGGGKVVGSVRVPIANPDFSPFVQRAKDTRADAIFMWVPGGSQPAALAKALAARGITSQNTTILGQGEITSDEALKNMGDAALGIVTSFHYDYEHPSKMNKAFVGAYNAAYHRNPDIFSIGGWDGMHLIYAVLQKTHGATDAKTLVDAAKGMSWESPRGPISIDPKTRDIIQNVYIRKVEKVDGKLRNVEIHTYKHVKDPVKARM